ncbi:hypothetical protein GALMADRAFT_258527 [Galerina marginata CBS 339.88]|uniref:Uncharacterized protein n=1 Tax=Galerina marginata (strain CBS 339.88) TaxID=685588 RepID=A0A067SK38_GALM3|nr:hypothetical protein GALMADRAFT_258527 [Galerina marginata CBS 339.88]
MRWLLIDTANCAESIIIQNMLPAAQHRKLLRVICEFWLQLDSVHLHPLFTPTSLAIMPTSMFGSQTVVTGGQFHQQNNTHHVHHHNPVSKDPWERLLEAASPKVGGNSTNSTYG